MPELHFKPVTVRLSSPVWNVIPFSDKPLIAIEQRDEVKRIASFSVYDYQHHRFLWRDQVAPEKWWVNLFGIIQQLVVLKVFESSENPDKTSLLFLSGDEGKPVNHTLHQNDWPHTNEALQPFQYLDGESDFETVRSFLQSKMEVAPRLGVEYLEYANHIIVSYYTGALAAFVNHLVIFNSKGECLYVEEIGTNLKGIGINTFFIASGNLFFVKNRTELVTFRIV